MGKTPTSHKRRSQPAREPQRIPVPRGIDAAPSHSSTTSSGPLAALMESAAQEILVVTCWFNPVPHATPYPATVRFSGRRVGVKGRLQPGDRFVHDEEIEEVIPGSGPVAVTARIRDITPGEWAVTTEVVVPPRAKGRRPEQIAAAPAAGPAPSAARLWRRWAPHVEPNTPVGTCLAPFAHVPGTLPGIWGVLVGLGMIVALALQAFVIAHDHLAVGPAWTVSLVAIAVGILGAKAWFVILHRREHRIEGWCIQGFIVGASAAAVILLLALAVPVGAFLDAAAPGLLIGLAVGRVGCFLAGCCGGPPTASRWGLWSSDQRVGARRIPTQLLESVFALGIGLAVLAGVLGHGPADGAFFVAALAAYTLGRQGLLRLRAEPRRTTIGGPVVAILAALALVASIVLLIR